MKFYNHSNLDDATIILIEGSFVHQMIAGKAQKIKRYDKVRKIDR